MQTSILRSAGDIRSNQCTQPGGPFEKPSAGQPDYSFIFVYWDNRDEKTQLCYI